MTKSHPPQHGAAMSFAEIGKKLGITGAGARFICKTALQKIRRDTEAVKQFQNLIEFRRSERDRQILEPIEWKKVA